MSELDLPWRVTLICCGRDDGHQDFATWDEADALRQSYEQTEGHERQGIVARVVEQAGDDPYEDNIKQPCGRWHRTGWYSESCGTDCKDTRT